MTSTTTSFAALGLCNCRRTNPSNLSASLLLRSIRTTDKLQPLAVASETATVDGTCTTTPALAAKLQWRCSLISMAPNQPSNLHHLRPNLSQYDTLTPTVGFGAHAASEVWFHTCSLRMETSCMYLWRASAPAAPASASPLEHRLSLPFFYAKTRLPSQARLDTTVCPDRLVLGDSLPSGRATDRQRSNGMLVADHNMVLLETWGNV